MSGEGIGPRPEFYSLYNNYSTNQQLTAISSNSTTSAGLNHGSIFTQNRRISNIAPVGEEYQSVNVPIIDYATARYINTTGLP